MKRRALIASADSKTIDQASAWLMREGFRITTAANAAEFLAALSESHSTVILVDADLPGLAPATLSLVSQAADAPVLTLVAPEAVAKALLVEGDCLPKPLDRGALLSRVRQTMRRSQQGQIAGEEIRCGDLVIDLKGRRVRIGDRQVDLTWSEFRILEALVREAGRALTRDELIERAFGPDYTGSARVIDQHIGHMRRKMGTATSGIHHIVTVGRVGYRLQ